MSMTQDVLDREEAIRTLVRQLPDDKRQQFFALAAQQLKDPDTYAVLNYLFIAGLHHFYLGNWLQGAINLLIFSFGLVLLLTGHSLFGLMLILVISVMELPALFKAQAIVSKYNNETMERIYQELSMAGKKE